MDVHVSNVFLAAVTFLAASLAQARHRVDELYPKILTNLMALYRFPWTDVHMCQDGSLRTVGEPEKDRGGMLRTSTS